jgi:hypothetical protein
MNLKRVGGHSFIGLAIGLSLAMTSSAALGNENCQKLEALAQQYAGVTLTSSQKVLKRRLVTWYKQNCGSRREDTRRVAESNR